MAAYQDPEIRDDGTYAPEKGFDRAVSNCQMAVNKSWKHGSAAEQVN